MSVAIPYNVEPRPDTGLYNAKFGVWLFLASEVMLFGALFSAYILLRTANNAPFAEGHLLLSTPIAFVNTLILIASSVTMVMSWVSLKLHDLGKFKLYMGITILCAFAFLGIKAYEYNEKFSHGNVPAQSTFLAIYFTITGLHAIHIIGGIVLNGYLWGPGAKMWKTEPERFTNRIEVAGLYWHFVDLVWIFLFPVLYLLP